MNVKSSTTFFLFRTAAALAIVILALASLPATSAYAAACSWDGSSSTSWTTGANWTGCTGVGGVPATIDTITIPSAPANQPTLSSNVTIAGLTVNSGATLTLGTSQLTVNGPVSNAGTITASSGRLMQQGVGNFTNSGTITFTGVGRIYFTGNVTNTGTMTLGSAEVRFYGSDAGPFTVPGFTTTGVIDWRRTAGTVSFTGNVSAGSFIMNDNAAAGTLNLGTGTHNFGTVDFSGGVGTLNADSSTINITTVSVTAWNYGTTTGSTFNPGTGTVIFNATGNQTIAGTRTKSFNNLTLSGASGVKSLAANTSVTGNLSIAPSGTSTASIAAGQNLSVNSLTLGGLGRISGTWGSTSSAATNKTNTYFAGTNGILTVGTDTRATSTISTLPTASGITYGQALSASTLTGGSASTGGSFAFTTPSTTPNAGTFSAPITFTPTDLTSYTTATGNVDVAVAQAALSGTASADSKTYDGLAYSGGNGVTYSGFVNGDTSSALGGTLTYSGDSQGAVNAGSYVITPGGLTSSNYTITFNNGTLTISAKPITITPDDGQSKVYGAADPAFTYTSSDLAATFSGILGRAAGSNVGSYAFTLGTLSAGSNYSLSLDPGHTFAITAKSVTITPDDGQSKVYGAADPVFTYTFAPALETGDSFTGALGRAAGSNVGPYAFTLGTLSAGSNYNLSLDPGHTFAITAKAIMVTADSGQSKVYGAADPVFTYGVAPALESGDSFTGALSRATGETVGPYALAQGTLSAGSNYTITFVSAGFNITAKPITVTADSGQSKVYGAADPVFTYGVAPALESGDSFTGALSRAAGEDVGPYALAQGTLSAGSNYTITFVSANFSITAKPITVTADSGQSKVYGAADPAFTYTSSDLAAVFTGALSRAAGETVAPYALAQGTLSAGSNYTITFVSANFNITPLGLTISGLTANDKPYDGNNTATLSGTPALVGVLGSDVVTLGGTPVATFADTNVGNAKSVTVSGFTLGGADAGNYTLTQPAGLTANITGSTLTVSGITASSKVYDATTTAALNTGSAALVGVISGDNVTLVTTGAAGAFADKNVGTSKTVTVSGLTLTGPDAGKYLLVQPTATANITSRDLTVSAAGVNKVYDGTTAATVTLSSDAVSGDIVTLAYTSAAFADPNVGNGKAVSVSGISISGADAGNYNLLNTTASTTANITLTITHIADTTGVFRPMNGLLYLKNKNESGFADMALNYGLPGDYPVVGDWDGNGTVTIGIYRDGYFYLRNENTIGFAEVVFPFGNPGDQPIAGDWDGDGVDTIGVFRSSTGQFLLRNSNTEGAAEMSFYLGNVGDVGIAGDWDGDGKDTTGVFRPSNGLLYLKNKNETGFADAALNYGLPGDKPVTGDWDGDGIDTIGVYRNGTFYLRNSNTLGFAEVVFDLGNPGDMPIAGDWDGLP